MATFLVTTTNDENNGGSSGDGLSLREAIILANATVDDDLGGPPSDDVIQLQGGQTYALSLPNEDDEDDEDLTATGDLDIEDALISGSLRIEVVGGGVATIDASGVSDRVFDLIAGADLTLENVVITGGSSVSFGGGIRVGNNATLTVANSTISGNSATYGGGISTGGNGSAGGTVSISSSTVDSNTANSNGGGIYSGDSNLTVANSTISGNGTSPSAFNDYGGGYGGGIFSYDGTTSVVNSTVTGNSATFGGGIAAYYGSTTVSNSIVSGNSATLYSSELESSTYSIFSGGNNLIGESSTGYGDAAYGFTFSGSDITASSDGSNPTALNDILDPALDNNGGPTQTHALVSGSPAIDAGSNANVPQDIADQDGDGDTSEAVPFDQRGTVARTTGGTVDIGAYEECFLTGTRILTEQGEKAVEELQIGDRVQTADGTMEPIKWIGRQTREPHQVRNPLRSYPIQIKAGALGNGLPHRDLFVSPDHALLLEGLLINAGALVNDISIIKTTPTDTFTYYHVELDKHALLVAEGAAAESYLPQKEDRLVYDNWEEYEEFYPHGSKIILWPLDYPRVSSTGTVPRYIRKSLRKIAGDLGLTEQVA